MLRGSTGVVLALASSLVKATTSYSSRRAHTILRNGSTSAYSASASEYEPLKKSRSFRIRARLLPTNERADDFVGPAETTKIVHFQRHAQGTQLLEFGRSAFFYLPRPGFSLTRKSSYHSLVWVGMHNAIYKEWTDKTGTPLDLSETDPMKNPLLLPRVIDSPLTPKGKDQCAEQRPAARALEGVELIVISPLVRCLQTAHITFEDHLPHNTPRTVKWMVHEGVREELGTLLCNKRRARIETEKLFPWVDFSRVPHGEDDVMWDNHAKRTANDDGIPTRETIEDMAQRSYDFLVDFLHMRPEREMAVVGHSAWLLAMTRAVLDVSPDDEGLIIPMFGQAEMRSMELVFHEQS